MGPWEGTGWVPVCTPPRPTLVPYPGYTPPLPMHCRHAPSSRTDAKYIAVGLISVAQLTLGPVFLHLRVMTEVYNLVEIGDR